MFCEFVFSFCLTCSLRELRETHVSVHNLVSYAYMKALYMTVQYHFTVVVTGTYMRSHRRYMIPVFKIFFQLIFYCCVLWAVICVYICTCICHFKGISDFDVGVYKLWFWRQDLQYTCTFWSVHRSVHYAHCINCWWWKYTCIKG